MAMAVVAARITTPSSCRLPAVGPHASRIRKKKRAAVQTTIG
jgi:hypothetical protein